MKPIYIGFIIVISILVVAWIDIQLVTPQPKSPSDIFTECLRQSPEPFQGTVQLEIVAECSLLANGK